MNLPRCDFLRTMPGGDGDIFCAHPRIHAFENRVTRAFCKACERRTERPRAAARPFTVRFAGPRAAENIQLVVARYKEDVTWLDRYQGLPAIVYEKGDPQAANALPNVGREAHTYLHHVVANYDRLAPLTVFLQGDPYAHVPDLDEKLGSLEWDLGYRDLGDYILVEDGDGRPVHPGLGLKAMYAELFGEPSPDFFVCHSAACFAVSRDNILRRPREFYEKALRLVLDRPLGPWEIERLWQHIFRTRVATRGIVTAACGNFFRDLQLFLLSCRGRNRYPVAVVDLGLGDEQRRWCLRERGVTVLRLPFLFPRVDHIRQQHWWQTWLKPFYIYHAPFDQVLWIDADCTLMSDPAAVFESIGEHPFLVRDGTIAVTENPPELYRHLPLPPGVRPEGINVNAGVVGLCKIRDRDLLNAWAHGVAWAAMNPDKQSLPAWLDQGILLWAAHRTGQTRFIRPDLTWNYPGRRISGLIARSLARGCSILDEIRRQIPEAANVHWLGIYKLSHQLDGELERLFAGEAGQVSDPSLEPHRATPEQ